MGNKNNFQIKIKYLYIIAFYGNIIEYNFKFDIQFFSTEQYTLHCRTPRAIELLISFVL